MRALVAFSLALISLFGATDSSTTNKKTSSKKTAYKKKSTVASTSTPTVTPKSKAAAPTAHAKSAPVSKGSVSKAPVSKTSPVASTGVKKSTSKSRPVVASYRRSAQQQPTPERYKEIQQALADKGYFAGQPDGEWGTSSVDALKRFQHDQNLTEDGKIGSVSLIALGLGPKRETPPAPIPAPVAPPVPPDQPTSIP